MVLNCLNFPKFQQQKNKKTVLLCSRWFDSIHGDVSKKQKGKNLQNVRGGPLDQKNLSHLSQLSGPEFWTWILGPIHQKQDDGFELPQLPKISTTEKQKKGSAFFRVFSLLSEFSHSTEVCWNQFFTSPILVTCLGLVQKWVLTVLDGCFCTHQHAHWNHQFHADFCTVLRLRDQLLTWHEWCGSNCVWMNWVKLFNFFTTPVLVHLSRFPLTCSKNELNQWKLWHLTNVILKRCSWWLLYRFQTSRPVANFVRIDMNGVGLVTLFVGCMMFALFRAWSLNTNYFWTLAMCQHSGYVYQTHQQ